MYDSGEAAESKGGKQDLNHDVTTWKESPLLLIKGFLMGSADIVPGVSGGTMALILGIYNRLLHAIKSVDTKFLGYLVTFRFKKLFQEFHWKFLVFLLGGIILAVIFFTTVVPLQIYMFTHPELVFGTFFGLILGSIMILLREIQSWSILRGLLLLIGTGIGFWVVNLVPTQTPETPLFVFLSGSVAICAMVLPGISGSYILLILRKYDFILSSIRDLQQSSTMVEAAITLLPFFLGAAVGLALFSRLLSWLLDRSYQATLLVLIGFLFGSLYVIWPYQDRVYEKHIETEILPMTDSRVKELMENPESRRQPEYHRLGKIVNPDAELEHLKNVEYQEVKQKLIKSHPYIPFITERQDKKSLTPWAFWSGLGGIVGGFVLVGFLDWLRRSGVSEFQ